jgi:hypothetical protein
MSLVAKLRAKVHRKPAVTVDGPPDHDLVAFVNEARTDAERQAVAGLAAMRARDRR